MLPLGDLPFWNVFYPLLNENHEVLVYIGYMMVKLSFAHHFVVGSKELLIVTISYYLEWCWMMEIFAHLECWCSGRRWRCRQELSSCPSVRPTSSWSSTKLPSSECRRRRLSTRRPSTGPCARWSGRSSLLLPAYRDKFCNWNVSRWLQGQSLLKWLSFEILLWW